MRLLFAPEYEPGTDAEMLEIGISLNTFSITNETRETFDSCLGELSAALNSR